MIADVALTVLILAITAMSLAWWRTRRRLETLRDALSARSQDLENLQLAFERFAPDEVVERVIAAGVSHHGERKEATVLFVDLVGFTALSEVTEPTDLVRILNGYFERMSRAITDHRGHVSTLVGDGMLALFGALGPNPWQGTDAVRAAIAMRHELEEYNRELEAEGLPTLSMGIGLHRGTGVAALVGSRQLMQFTLVGRVVNLAARIEAATRNTDADILITRALRDELDARFHVRELAPIEVKGVEGPVDVFAVDGFSEDP